MFRLLERLDEGCILGDVVRFFAEQTRLLDGSVIGNVDDDGISRFAGVAARGAVDVNGGRGIAHSCSRVTAPSGGQALNSTRRVKLRRSLTLRVEPPCQIATANLG